MKSTAAAILSLLFVHQSLAEEPRRIGVGVNPESVTKGFGGKYFVTVMGADRNPGGNDGSVVVIDGETVKPFVDGLDDPKGIVFLDDSLILAEMTKIWKIDAKGGKKLLVGPEAFPHPVLYLNDVAISADGLSVLVTDMGARDKISGPDGFWPLDSAEAKAVPAVGRVYRVGLDGKVTEVIAADERMKCPNGVDMTKDGKIRVAEFFTGNVYEWDNGNFRIIAEGHRSADTIAHDSKGNFYVTEVRTGQVFRYPGKVKMAEGMSSAADGYVDEEAGCFVVPDLKAGKLVFLKL